MQVGRWRVRLANGFVFYKIFQKLDCTKKNANRKKMFEFISKELDRILASKRIPEQCDTGVKTILKRKKNAVDNNRKSGPSRQKYPTKGNQTYFGPVMIPSNHRLYGTSVM